MEVSLLQISFTEIDVCVCVCVCVCIMTVEVYSTFICIQVMSYMLLHKDGQTFSVTAQRMVSVVLPCCRWQHRGWCLQCCPVVRDSTESGVSSVALLFVTAKSVNGSTESGVCRVALLSVTAQRVVSAALPCCQWQHREWCLQCCLAVDDRTESGVCSVALLSVIAQSLMSVVLPCCWMLSNLHQWQHLVMFVVF